MLLGGTRGKDFRHKNRVDYIYNSWIQEVVTTRRLKLKESTERCIGRKLRQTAVLSPSNSLRLFNSDQQLVSMEVLRAGPPVDLPVAAQQVKQQRVDEDLLDSRNKRTDRRARCYQRVNLLYKWKLSGGKSVQYQPICARRTPASEAPLLCVWLLVGVSLGIFDIYALPSPNERSSPRIEPVTSRHNVMCHGGIGTGHPS